MLAAGRFRFFARTFVLSYVCVWGDEDCAWSVIANRNVFELGICCRNSGLNVVFIFLGNVVR